MSVFKRIFGIGVTKPKQLESKKEEIPFLETAGIMDFNRMELLRMAVDEFNFTTHERGQYLELIFSHDFFNYHVRLVREKHSRERQIEKLKMYLLNRVLPEHQLN
tara:strand:+ start:161 stop:475 length:315 start_codon:yes stop_codon:yes gene_type:complete